MNAERRRLLEAPAGRSPWRHWGPYLSERAWGTVREDYSAGGDAWDFFPHHHARSRACRWNEDGLGGICDDRQTAHTAESVAINKSARSAPAKQKFTAPATGISPSRSPSGSKTWTPENEDA